MKRLAIVLMCLVFVLSMAACSSKDNSGSNAKNADATQAPADNSGDKSGEKVELTMWMFTGTGLEPYVEQYQKDHPNIKVNIQQQEYADHHNSLVTALAAGSGAPDIALVEIGYIDRFKADESKFNNLADFGANDIMGNYLEWKKVQASSADGNFIFGLPTDVGPMVMMYRTDIFEAAGLSTDPADVTNLISSWDKFIEVGKTIKEKTGKPMIDNANSIYEVLKGQLPTQYFDKDGNLIVDTNEDLKKAYDRAAEIIQAGLSAKVAAWSPEWGAGMNNGDFAIQLAPAWMMGFMKANAPDSSGKWNVAQMPEGSGNWGGSFMTIPKESAHPKEAYDLISWLLSPELQLEEFKSNGNFPSTPSVYDKPEIQDLTDPFFSNAPVGKIFAEAAKKVVPVYYGPDYITVNTPLVNAITNVETNNADPQKEWDAAIKQIQRDMKK